MLRTVVDGRMQICPKVGLGDLFFAETGDRQKNRAFTNRIDRKHVDFVLCDPQTLRPLVAVELDDRSHEREDRQKRDALVEGVFAAAGLPLVRVPVRSAYPPWELEAKLAPYLTRMAVPPVRVSPMPNKAEEPASPSAPAVTKDTAPTCPKCGGTMLMRKAKSGANAGGQFSRLQPQLPAHRPPFAQCQRQSGEGLGALLGDRCLGRQRPNLYGNWFTRVFSIEASSRGDASVPHTCCTRPASPNPTMPMVRIPAVRHRLSRRPIACRLV